MSPNPERPTAVGERTLPDLGAVAVALAQQDRRRRISVRDDIDVHGQVESRSGPDVKCKTSVLQVYISVHPNTLSPQNSMTCTRTASKVRTKVRLPSDVPHPKTQFGRICGSDTARTSHRSSIKIELSSTDQECPADQ